MSLSEEQMRELVERINTRIVDFNEAIGMLRFVAEGEPVLAAEGEPVIEDEVLLGEVRDLFLFMDAEVERLLYTVAAWIKKNRPSLFAAMAHKVAVGKRHSATDSMLSKAFLTSDADPQKSTDGN